MADGEDAAMDRDQPAAAETPIDRATTHAERGELRAGHDPMLTGGQRADRRVRRTRRTFTIHISANVRLDPHAPMVARLACRNSIESHQHCGGTPRTSKHLPLGALARTHTSGRGNNHSAG
jgi:hypothetical protein